MIKNAPDQTIVSMQKQFEALSNGNRRLRDENVELRNEIKLLNNEINSLLACCSLEKKVDYMLKKWLDEPTNNLEIDRQAFALKLVETARKELQ